MGVSSGMNRVLLIISSSHPIFGLFKFHAVFQILAFCSRVYLTSRKAQVIYRKASNLQLGQKSCAWQTIMLGTFLLRGDVQ